MSELHLAAMPFPTRQGTQAVIDAMMNARHEGGRAPHLLTYGEGEGTRGGSRDYVHHRAASVPGRRDFGSGPSARKLVQDALVARRCAALARALGPRVVVAHHVEAAIAALFAGVGPLIFFAHTDVGAELPTYAERLPSPILERAGRALDAELCRRAAAVAAISPALRDALAAATDREIVWVAPPWPLPASPSDAERRTARRGSGTPADERRILYAGNLDGYQGWPALIAALAQLPTDARLVVATASKTDALRREALAAGVSGRVEVVALPGDEAGRRALYASADLAVVPRRTPGGLPIKLLDALARGVPTAASRRAAAGLPLDGAALLAEDDDPGALAAALRVALAAPRAAEEIGARGRDYVRRVHAPSRFDAALEALCFEASAQSDARKATRSSISASLR